MMDTPSLAPDPDWPPESRRWPPELPPPCACAWGDDRYGLWMDVEISGVIQRFRWIEPGEFLMGSPADEPGRYGGEGPRHLVRITRGYWLADTACSQALWQAVMDGNPSRFKDDPQNPVEQVSWQNVRNFLRRLETRLPGGRAELPTEAEWEYACRAGTETPFNFGIAITPERANYDGTISYAHGPTGEWRQRTVPVKSFQPNAWGLYQMHGNVWEWCLDGRRDYSGIPQLDPCSRGGNELRHVMRGGSWDDVPWALRSATRDLVQESRLLGYLGFRFLLRFVSPDATQTQNA